MKPSPPTPKPRDLTDVSTDALERSSAKLSEAIHALEGNPHSNVQPLKDAVADIEAELIRRTQPAPAETVPSVIRIRGRQLFGSGL